MSQFLRLLAETDKAQALAAVCARLRRGETDPRHFEVAPDAFDAVPGKPFAYWVSQDLRETFTRLPPVESANRRVCFGLSTKDDTSFLRLAWEVPDARVGIVWIPFVKGGAFSPYYADPYLLLDWQFEGKRLKAFADHRTRQIFGVGSWSRWINNWNEYFRPGLTWPRRTQGGLSLRAMPAGCIFADKGPAAFVEGDDSSELLPLLALTNSHAFGLLVALQMAFGSYEVGVIQKTPIPTPTAAQRRQLAKLARRAWSLKRSLDTVNETSHAFVLPAALRPRAGDFDPPAIAAELARIQTEIDALAFDLYGFSAADRQAATAQGLGEPAGEHANEDEDAQETEPEAPPIDALLSWAVGVAFGRFDWRLATGERAAPPEPEPFDPLPAKSPGMLPDGAEPFHAQAGILVDDQGHPHDLAHLIEEVLARVAVAVPDDVRRWLQRDFFAFHLQRYSRSRRKAPIYWPLSTTSGSYTLWLYHPSLTSQTLYTAINDFIEPKLRQVGADVTALRNKGAARSRDDEKHFETLQAFELELIELRDTLLKLAPTYQPNFDDGVQISAAPLWPLFRHKPWQKLLKDTWAKLEKGDYDWAHLAMNYWPDRVREKCKTDKSLAIAHGLEDLYEEPEAKSKKNRNKMKAGGEE